MVEIKSLNTDKYYYINAYIDGIRVGKLGIEYCGSKKIHINYVITSESHTGKGIATMLLNKAIETFKTYEISLTVVPMPRKGENLKYRTIKGLTEFYGKFGFKRTDDPCFVKMILNN